MIKKRKKKPSHQLIKNFLISNLCLDPERYKTQFSKSIKKFYPVEKLFYAYFTENSEQFNNYKSLFYDINIVNTQRYRFYNGNIYSFVGFNDDAKRNEFIIAHKDLMIEFHSYPEKLCHNYYRYADEDYFTSLIEFNINPLQEKMTNNDVINKNDDNSDESNYRTFEPKVNIFYLYFEEKAQPNKKLSDKSYQKIFGINFANDIQRFHYLPRKNKIFTFIGFSKQNDLNKAQNIQSLKSSAINQRINIFNPQTQTKSKSQKSNTETNNNNNNPEQSTRDKIINKSNEQVNINQYNTKNDNFHYSPTKTSDKNTSIVNTQEITDKSKSKSNTDQLNFSPKIIPNLDHLNIKHQNEGIQIDFDSSNNENKKNINEANEIESIQIVNLDDDDDDDDDYDDNFGDDDD